MIIATEDTESTESTESTELIYTCCSSGTEFNSVPFFSELILALLNRDILFSQDLPYNPINYFQPWEQV